MIQCYQSEGIILEPAGGLAVASLSQIHKTNPESLKNKNVVCIASGGNNDIDRYPLIQEKVRFFRGTTIVDHLHVRPERSYDHCRYADDRCRTRT